MNEQRTRRMIEKLKEDKKVQEKKVEELETQLASIHRSTVPQADFDKLDQAFQDSTKAYGELNEKYAATTPLREQNELLSREVEALKDSLRKTVTERDLAKKALEEADVKGLRKRLHDKTQKIQELEQKEQQTLKEVAKIKAEFEETQRLAHTAMKALEYYKRFAPAEAQGPDATPASPA
jgi:DNA repair exonuclease SbcCD ATPase subunit